jgi:hypothetical protein
MAVGSESLQGARLEFVLRELPGTVLVRKITPPPSKRKKDADPELENKSSNVIEVERAPAGYMIFFPNSSCYRLSPEEAKRRGFLDRRPAVLNLESVKDTTTAAGRFKFAIEEAEKRKAYRDMEDELIRRCTRGGKIENMLGPECDYDPKGKIEPKKVA